MISAIKSIELRHWVSFWVFVFSVTVLSAAGHGGQASIVLLFTGLYVMFAKRGEDYRVPLSSQEKAFIGLVLVFWLIQLAGVIYQPTGYEYETLRERFKAFDYPMRWLLLIPVFLLFRSYLLDWKFVAVGMSFGAIVAAGIAHYQIFYLGVARASGASNHIIPFSNLMVAVDLLLWMFMLYAWDRGYKILSAFILFASLAAFYGSLLSVTRGAWLAYIAMLLIWILYTLGKTFKNLKHLISLPIIARFFFAGLLFLAVSQTDQYKRIEARTVASVNGFSKGGIQTAERARAILFEDSISSIKSNPWGIGTDNFNAIRVNSPHMQRGVYRFTHAHNELLNLWVENGIQGLLVFTTLILLALYVFWNGLKLDNQLARVYSSSGLMLVVSYAIFGQSQSVFSHHDTLIFFVFYLYLFFGQIQLLKRAD